MSALAAVSSVVVLTALLISGGAARFAAALTEFMLASGLPRLLQSWLTWPAYAICVWALLEGLLLPIRFFQGFVLERRYEQSRIQFFRWVVTHGTTLGLNVLVVVSVTFVFRVSLAAWPDRWWVVCGLVFAAAMIGLTYLAPVYLIPSLYRVKLVSRPLLREQLEVVAGQAGVAALPIEEYVISTFSPKACATLVGLGPTRRILVSDTLLADYSDDEIEVVLAHEMGHHVHCDIWQLMTYELAVVLLALLAADWSTVHLVSLFGVSGLDDLSVLPLLALVVGGVVMFATPLGHALSRRQERRADRFALETTGKPAALISSLRRLGEQNLAEERPSRLVELLYCSHPPLHRRLAYARLPTSS